MNVEKLTPIEIEFEKFKRCTICQRCGNSCEFCKAVSFFTNEFICGDCFKKENEVQYKMRRRGINVLKYENIGYVPEV